MSDDRPSLRSPDLFPLTFDGAGQRVRFLGLSERIYETASFLDERILLDRIGDWWLPWPEVVRAVATWHARCDFIFHLGHVGSTLFSRLLGASDRVFALREPAVLRALSSFDLVGAKRCETDDPNVNYVARVFLKLLGRVYRPPQRSLVKTTSYVAEIADRLLTTGDTANAVLMFVEPDVYLATIFRGAPSRREARANAAMRLDCLHRRLEGEFWSLSDLSEGETIAMIWTSGMLALAAIASNQSWRTQWLDFEALLRSPGERLSMCLRHFHEESSSLEVDPMLNGPYWHRYSKDLRFAYDRDLRNRDLARARIEHAAEIARGIAWLRSVKDNHPVVASALSAPIAAVRDAT